jgi:splicing factor 3B subunit 3
LVVGSDSGKISIIEFDVTLNDWKTVHCEVFGKTGCRRIVPGQYLAADPKGRAIMIAGVEKQKFVYVMNRDSANRLTISSPLEAHKSETVLFSTCGVDVGFDNPIFAMLELEYTEADQDPSGEAAAEVEKKLTFYELDLGLNHVVRKWSEPVSRTANLLLTVPGGDDGPSGVLICGENWVSYKNQGHVEVRAPLPRRRDMPKERGLLVTTGTMHKQKDLFFFLLQSELGDLYKVTLELDPSDPKIVQNVVVTVFDTIAPANSLCITKTGLLFAASEFGNHALFQFQGIGDDPDAVRSGRIVDEQLNEELGDDSLSAARVAPQFTPSPKLQNLLLTDDIESLAPITDMMVDDVAGEESKQIVTLCGKGNRSTLRVLRHGVSVTEMAVSELPGRPTAVWTVRGTQESEVDKYIVVSFTNATLVLSIGENVEEVTDSGFLATSPTLQVVLLADNALLQVHSQGIRHIRPDQRTSEWKTPGKRMIERAAVNSRQVAISLSGGEIIYFELDAAGQLMEMGTLDLGKEISCLDLGLVPAGRLRSSFLAVGCLDQTVQLLSLDPADVLAQRSTMTLSSPPTSLCLVQMVKERGAGAGGGQTDAPTLYLNVGVN